VVGLAITAWKWLNWLSACLTTFWVERRVSNISAEGVDNREEHNRNFVSREEHKRNSVSTQGQLNLPSTTGSCTGRKMEMFNLHYNRSENTAAENRNIFELFWTKTVESFNGFAMDNTEQNVEDGGVEHAVLGGLDGGLGLDDLMGDDIKVDRCS